MCYIQPLLCIYIYISARAQINEDSGEEKEMKKCVDTRERREREKKGEKLSIL
tara:strand:- start:898 stop:1056 length:159 start_codon:yes stop_codon:yes gene_type:complete